MLQPPSFHSTASMKPSVPIKISVVEDVPELLEDLEFHLTGAGYQVTCVESSLGFWREFKFIQPDIIILDIGLPDGSGLNIAQKIRTTHPHIGIVMLTGRSLLADRMSGRHAGADDYLTKPVQLEELILVLQNLAHRLHLAPKGKYWLIETQSLRLTAPTSNHMALTKSEYKVFHAWATEPNQQATRQRIVESMGYAWSTYDERRLEALISRLRKKIILELEIHEPPIRNLRGEGYAFTESLKIL